MTDAAEASLRAGPPSAGAIGHCPPAASRRASAWHHANGVMAALSASTPASDDGDNLKIATVATTLSATAPAGVMAAKSWFRCRPRPGPAVW